MLIARDGALTQYVPFGMRAWHAGTSHWRGRDDCNDFSVGVELEGTDEEPYDERQYEALADSSRRCSAPIRRSPKAGSPVTATSRPGARPIPGPAFDWRRLERDLRARGAAFRREVLA